MNRFYLLPGTRVHELHAALVEYPTACDFSCCHSTSHCYGGSKAGVIICDPAFVVSLLQYVPALVVVTSSLSCYATCSRRCGAADGLARKQGTTKVLERK